MREPNRRDEPPLKRAVVGTSHRQDQGPASPRQWLVRVPCRVHGIAIAYEWRQDFESSEVNALHAEAFGHPVFAVDDWDWKARVHQHSLGWVCARDGGDLVCFVDVAWDGVVHAFVLDTMVALSVRRQGIGTELGAVAVTEARRAGCEWLHVEFEDHLRKFYFDGCGFEPTNAGRIAL